ncbi:CD1375 family protein [Clostridium sp. SYSU_GA19001]|nr:CD1375 family protein [Clostridium caldaquaticum]MCM8710551.1 CD1375 family protein [Clostridium caldaquaticum]
MIKIYADLVEQGLRALEENDGGIPIVPINLRDRVRTELESRKL